MGILISLAIGCLCGFLAGKLFKGSGNGLILNIILGLVGSALGSWLVGKVLGLGSILGGGLLGEIVTGTLGAILILWVVSLFKGKN